MAIDLIRGGRTPSRGFKATKSSNCYLKSLIKVHLERLSFTPSWAEEPNPNSIKLYIKDSINPDSIDTQSHCPES